MRMTRRLPDLSRLHRRLLISRSGVAMVEFALAAPLLMTVGLLGTETANFVVTVLRINQLAMMAADNAARVRAGIDEVDVNDVMIGVRFAGEPIAFGTRGRIIISDLEPNGQTGGSTGYKIGWQRCFGAKNVVSMYGVQGTGATDATIAHGVTPDGIAATAADAMAPPPLGALMLAEVRYTYQPLIAPMYMAATELRAVQAFPVRDRAEQTLTNRTSMAASAQRLCDAAHLSAD